MGRKVKAGFVYVFGNYEYGFYKIGASEHPKYRMRIYADHLPFEVEMVHVILCDDASAIEERIHEVFAEKRVRLEWFKLDEEDLDVVKHLYECRGGKFRNTRGDEIDIRSTEELDMERFLYPERFTSQTIEELSDTGTKP